MCIARHVAGPPCTVGRDQPDRCPTTTPPIRTDDATVASPVDDHGDRASVMDEDILDSLAEEEKRMVVNVAKRHAGYNKRKINALIREFVAKTAVCNREYDKVWMEEWGHGDYPFLYKEREVYSLMSVVMHQITPVLQSESRITRKRDRRNQINKGKEQEGRGWVDL